MALYKRGRVYHYRFRINGRRYRGSTKKTTLTAARRIEALAMARAEERGGVLPLRRSPVLREFSKRFLEWVENQRTLKQKSKDYYANGWRLLADTDLAGMRIDAISQDDTGVLSFPGGQSNHNNALRTLRRMLGKAEEWRVLIAAPKIKPQQDRERERIIDEHVEAKLLPRCKQPLRHVLMIMRDAGMRNQKEVFTMRWEHLDWSNSRYFVYDSKTPKGRRHVPISPRVLRALLARYSDQKEGWVFLSKRAKCGHLTTVARQFQDARKDAGLPDDLVLYCARHGFGTEMYRATKNLFAVMTAMGHAAVATTTKYQHHDIDEIAHVASQRVQ